MTEEDGRTPSKEASKYPNKGKTIHTARVGTQLYMSPEQVPIHHYTLYKVAARNLSKKKTYKKKKIGDSNFSSVYSIN